MVQGGGGPGLATEGLHEPGLVGAGAVEHLRGHGSVQDAVPALVNTTHAAGTDDVTDLVAIAEQRCIRRPLSTVFLRRNHP